MLGAETRYTTPITRTYLQNQKKDVIFTGYS